MHIKMDDSSFEVSPPITRKRRPARGRQRSMRGNPEGNSISQKDACKLTAPPNSDNDISDDAPSPVKIRKTGRKLYSDEINQMERQYLVQKSQKAYPNSELSLLDETDTPESLSQISEITTVTDASLYTTFSRFRQPRGKADVTWEKAVQSARGQPDGAERSFHAKKLSKSSVRDVQVVQKRPVSVMEVAAEVISDTSSQDQSDQTKTPEKPLQRRKSIKVKLKRAASTAASKLKALKTKQSLDDSRTTGQHRIKLEDSQVDVPAEDAKKPQLKELPWKDRKKVRKMLKNNFDMIQRSKQIWEELRKHEMTEERRFELCKELMTMVKGKIKEYGKLDQKEMIFEELKDQICTMAKSKYGRFLVKKFLMYGTKHHRNCVFKSFHGEVRKLVRHRTPDIKSLDQMLQIQPDKRDMILSNMKEALLPLIDKSILVHSMVHRVFFEYFVHAKEKNRIEMAESLRESVVHMLHTRDGSRVGMYCVWYGTAKEIVKHLPELAQDQYGRKVLLYLLSPRDPLHFHPDIVRVLQEGDKNPNSKKDRFVRQRELLEYASLPFLKYISENARKLVMDNASLLLILAILTHAIGDPSEAMAAMAKIASEPFVAGSLEKMHIVEHPAGHMTLKRLIQNDKDRIQAGQSVIFSKVLLDTLPDGALKSWAAFNRGCFTLVFLLELDHPDITDIVTTQLTGIRKSLKKMTLKGAQILLQKLDKLNGEYKL
ncbi:hypothetical protein KUTeg_016887 [Tegillarca granosa]|uniref:CPL domain-containing protein n=1 Tax=Tegillarca granosa TaxID=220873 RepID=A0ABQ9ES03_TEGGR|nr:hypothetical protein KUTeg_016887 [Tegillarca granosa]